MTITLNNHLIFLEYQYRDDFDELAFEGRGGAKYRLDSRLYLRSNFGPDGFLHPLEISTLDKARYLQTGRISLTSILVHHDLVIVHDNKMKHGTYWDFASLV